MTYVAPVQGEVMRTGRYGKRGAIPRPGAAPSPTNHEGVDIRAAIGTPVYPVIGGTVIQVKFLSAIVGRRIFTDPGAGNVVVIRGDDGLDHVYGHLDSFSVNVGDRVNIGSVFARSGKTGVYEPHLHYGMWREYAPNKWRSIDPTTLLPWTADKFGELTINTETEDIMDWKDRYLLGLIAESQGRVERAVVGQSADLDTLQASVEALKLDLADRSV